MQRRLLHTASCCAWFAAAAWAVATTQAQMVIPAQGDAAAAAERRPAAALAGTVQGSNPELAAAAAQTASDSLLQLTASNWTDQISKGMWLVEFQSPYCTPCRAFASTWQELNANKLNLRSQYPAAPFILAQVDCNSQIDLCISEGVKHMPRLTLYREGKQITSEFQGNREYTELSAFIDSSAAEYRSLKGVTEPVASEPQQPVAGPQQPVAPAKSAGDAGAQVPNTPFLTPQQPAPGPAPAPAQQAPAPAAPPAQAAPAAPQQPPVQQQPRPAKEAPAPPRTSPAPVGPNPFGAVLQYGKDEIVKDLPALHAILDKSGKHGSTFVKFFAPWCPHCRAMAGAYQQVAESLRGRVNVVEVNCEEHRNVCSTFGITSYPTLRMYNQGEATLYRGSRSFQAMRDWALKAGSAAGVHDIGAGQLSSIAKNEDVFFLYLHSTNTPKREIDAVSQATRALLTSTVQAYRSADALLISRFQSLLGKSGGSIGSGKVEDSLSGLLAFKDHDAEKPSAILHPSDLVSSTTTNNASKEIGAWLERERYPTVIELTGETFSEVLNNRQGAPVVLAALSAEHHSGRNQGTGTGSLLRNDEVQALREVALQWRARKAVAAAAGEAKADQLQASLRRPQKVLFAWIDADRWATALKRYYKIKLQDVPRLVLADGARLEYYDLPSRFVDPYTTAAMPASVKKPSWLYAPDVFDALDNIWQGRGPKPSSSRTYLDRGMQGTAGAIEELLVLMAQHIFLTLVIAVVAVAALVSLSRRRMLVEGKARGLAGALGLGRRQQYHAAQRLPQYTGKSD